MPFNPITFIIGSEFAKQQNIDEQRAIQLGFLAGMMPLAPGLLVTKVMADREAPAPSPTTPTAPEMQYVLTDLRGRPVIDAVEELGGYHIKVGAISYQSDQDPKSPIPAGAVLAAKPDFGRPIPQGQSVDLTVNTGPVPADLQGKTERDAINELGEMHFELGNVGYRSDRAPAGLVIDTDPAPGEPAQGNKVSLLISLGPVPEDLIGKPESDAINELVEGRFELGDVDYRSDRAPVESVIDTDPAPGEPAQDNKVSLIISLGPVPGKIKLPLCQAAWELGTRHFAINVVDQNGKEYKCVPVVDQTPCEDVLKKGQEVSLTVRVDENTPN